MSYWVSMNCPHCGALLRDEVSPEEIKETDLSVTYNYGRHYANYLGKGGLRNLDGKTGAECQAILQEAVTALGTTSDSDDYWDPTPGNAGYALNILLRWAKQHPDVPFNVY